MSSDPRVFFAAERTLLAWVRTGLTIMAFGFVVARFGLFLHLLRLQAGNAQASPHMDLSKPVGIALMLLGVGCFVLGAIQHRSYVATLSNEDVPRSHHAIFPVGLSMLLALLGLVLAAYLAF
jgi:putative membrane protein